MTRIVQLEEAEALTGQLKHMAYNAADCCGTREIANVLLPKVEANPRAARTYAAERAFQAPAMACMLRGIRVDLKARKEVLEGLERDIEEGLVATAALVSDAWDGLEMESGECQKPARKDKKHKWQSWEKGTPELGRLCVACGAPRFRTSTFNANSSAQARHLFHDLLGVPKKDMMNKKREFSCDEEVLERIGRKYPKYRPITEAILAVRDLAKQRGDVKAPLSPTGRYMFSLNIGATHFGRSSSSKNCFGLGGNIQNKAERHRKMFVADPGYEMAYCDLKQAESLVVAYLADDEAYIEAHRSGDLHTYVCRLLFPEHPWTGDIRADRKLAESINPEWDLALGHNIRFQAKRNTHGYAYRITPEGTARIVHISVAAAREAHERLDRAFPNIKGVYQEGVVERMKQQLPIVTALGREIQFFGRPWDEATWKQGCAAEPQSIVGDLPYIAMHRIWKEHDPHLIQVLANCHDALLLQWKIEDREEAIAVVVEAMEIPVIMPSGKVCKIPVEVAVGANWGKYNDNPKKGPLNLNGMKGVYG